MPDSINNEPKSHGFIEFTIAQNKDLPEGTIIENQAAIYFDFNEPIFTNRVFNTIGFPFVRIINDVVTSDFSDYQTIVMPNPFRNRAIIELKGEAIEGHVLIFNTLGREVRQLPLQNNQAEFARNNMESGIYFYQIVTRNKSLISSGSMIVQGN